MVYAKRPLAGPAAVLEYLSRYTHRVAIASSRLIAHDERGVTFKYKDYRKNSHERYKNMTLDTEEFMRRFLLYVLPTGLHRIRHYGLFANAQYQANLARARELLAMDQPGDNNEAKSDDDGVIDSDHQEENNEPQHSAYRCPACGAAMIVIKILRRGQRP